MADLIERPRLLPSRNARPILDAVVDVEGRLDDMDMGYVSTVLDPSTCPPEFLPYLAWQRSVDSWDATWPESIKRAVISAAPMIHRLKGTRRSVELALGALGMRTQLVEWWQAATPEAPYTFRVTAFATLRYVRSGPLITRELTQSALTAVRASSPVSRLFEFRIGVELRTDLGAAVAGTAYGLTTPRVSAAPLTRVRRGLGASACGTAYGHTTPSVQARALTGVNGNVRVAATAHAFLAANVGVKAGPSTRVGSKGGVAASGRAVALARAAVAARPITMATGALRAAAAGRAVIFITAQMDIK